LKNGAAVKTTRLWVGVLLLLGSCPLQAADDPEWDAVVKDNLALMERATKVLAAIKDEKMLKAATPALKRIGQQRRALARRYGKLKLSREQEAKLKKKYREQVASQQRKFNKEKARVKKIRGGQQALDLLEGKAETKKPE
jgi:hypothetical protein